VNMKIEAILLIAVIATGFIAGLDRILYPRHSRLFRGKPKLVRISQNLFPILLVILLVRAFTFEAFRIPSASMKPSLLEGDVVVVDKYSLGLRMPLLGYRITAGKPKRGDIAVFRGEIEGEKSGIIKRIVGLPGDHIKYVNRTLYINGIPAAQYDLSVDLDNHGNGNQEKIIRATEDLGAVKHGIYMSLHGGDDQYKFADLIVPANSYFVLGDNRNNSLDSRYWGVLADKELVGKARLIAFSLDWSNKHIRWRRIGKLH
jgi:signal peptidase I